MRGWIFQKMLRKILFLTIFSSTMVFHGKTQTHISDIMMFEAGANMSITKFKLLDTTGAPIAGTDAYTIFGIKAGINTTLAVLKSRYKFRNGLSININFSPVIGTNEPYGFKPPRIAGILPVALMIRTGAGSNPNAREFLGAGIGVGMAYWFYNTQNILSYYFGYIKNYGVSNGLSPFASIDFSFGRKNKISTIRFESSFGEFLTQEVAEGDPKKFNSKYYGVSLMTNIKLK